MFTFALIDNGSEIDNVQAGTFATESEAQAAGELALDGVCPRGSAHRRFYRVEVRAASKITAVWAGTEYTVRDWHSADGDNWTDGEGLPVETPEFFAASITLSGGPRSGETVG